MELFEKKMLDTIGKKLIQKDETVAVAESVTSGLLQFAFSNIKDASCFFQGGVTAFNIGQKYKHLRVEPIHALSVNCVSQKVATEMAMKVEDLFNSDWGIGVTGYASPVEASGNKIFAFYAITYKNKTKAKGKITSKKPQPPEAQQEFVNAVMKHLLKSL